MLAFGKIKNLVKFDATVRRKIAPNKKFIKFVKNCVKLVAFYTLKC